MKNKPPCKDCPVLARCAANDYIRESMRTCNVLVEYIVDHQTAMNVACVLKPLWFDDPQHYKEQVLQGTVIAAGKVRDEGWPDE